MTKHQPVPLKLCGPETQPLRPHNNCYWLIPGKLLAGEYPGHATDPGTRLKMRRFLEAGVDFFIDLTEPHELYAYESALQIEAAARSRPVTYRRMSIKDINVPTPEKMRAILDTIDEAIAAGRTVYAHCWGGIGRTGTVVGCYLVRHGNSGDEALQEIARLWKNMEKSRRVSRSPETDEQHRYVRQWE